MRRLVRTTSRSLPVLAAAVLSACAPATTATRVTGAEAIRATLDSAGLLAQEPGPEIRVRTEQEFGNSDYIEAVLRLDDDAYVMVVNVGPDGYARVIFPESPSDDGLLRAGRSYKLPTFFPGFATNVSAVSSGYNAFVPFRRSEFASVLAQGPGYVFAIASSRPMNLQMVEDFGMWDDYRIPSDGMLLDPRFLVRYYQEAALGEGRISGVTAAVARYAGWVPAMTRLASASCAWGYGPRFSSLASMRLGYGFGAYPIWATTASMGYGAGGYCPGGTMYRPYMAFNPLMYPHQVAQGPTTQAPTDSGSTQPNPRPKTRPVGHPLDPDNPPLPATPAVITDGETILLTPQARAMARREALLERDRRLIEGSGGPAWTRRAGSTGRPIPRGAESSGSAGGRSGGTTSLP
ncbi:MAG TPA: DUF4384 domain-containing protein, partial [Gemmatimonadaceae bacterium]